MHYLYILYSASIDKYYVGETIDFNKRLQEHLMGTFKGSFTSQTKDWKTMVCMQLKDISAARKAEHFIKRMNSREFIQKLIFDHKWFLEKFNS